MGKNASKGFVNQFKNTRRQADRRPLVGQAGQEQRKLVQGAAGKLKKFFPGQGKSDKNTDRGDK
jgi:hypothetical protein